MAEHTSFLAFDFGAESGRALLARIDADSIRFEEIHRFPNGALQAFGSLYWDPLRLFGEMREAMRRCAGRLDGEPLAGIGVDTWGVDFALLDRNGELVGYPHHYRDPRTEGVQEEVFRRVSREEIFRQTGIQFLPFNTIYQLYSMVRSGSPLLEAADRLVMMPGLFNYLLTGRAVEEFTNATTTQLFNPLTNDWADPLFETLGLPRRIMPEVVPPGRVIGPLHADLRSETGLGAAPVIAPACHDTGSAVAAVPAVGTEDWAYLSSGTWSLMGVELREPNLSAAALRHNFTNEGGVDGTYRFLKNIMGLWLIQECRRQWRREGMDLDYSRITEEAAAAPAFAAFVNPDDPSFLSPGEMPSKIQAWCRRTGQSVPATPGAIARCVLESLALTYRIVLRRIEETTGRKISVLHVVGGGIRNRLLCRFTASACGIPVLAGPAEATALGNVLVQGIAAGVIGSLAEGRARIARTEPPERYEPEETDRWDEAAATFAEITGIEG